MKPIMTKAHLLKMLEPLSDTDIVQCQVNYTTSMTSITVTGILLVLVGLYASFRGIAMGKPIVKRNTFREIGDMWVGIIGFYECALGVFFISSQI